MDKKELKIFKHKEKDDCYLLGYVKPDYINQFSISGILLKDGKKEYNKGYFCSGWNDRYYNTNNNILSGNISISFNVYLDSNNNPVMKCSSVNGTRYILINTMERYKGALDLKKVDKVIIKVH